MPNQVTIIDNQYPALIELVVLQGATLNRSFGFVQTLNPKVYMDFTGWIAYAIVRGVYDGPNLLEMSTANGRIVLGLQGTAPYQYNCLISVNATTTDALSDWGTGVWDLELYDTFGKIYRWVEGPARLSRAATR